MLRKVRPAALRPSERTSTRAVARLRERLAKGCETDDHGDRYIFARSSSRSSKRRGNDVYEFTLVIPPKGQANLVQKMLVEEMGTATNIKSRVNRQSVLDTIGSAPTAIEALQQGAAERFGGSNILEDVIDGERKEDNEGLILSRSSRSTLRFTCVITSSTRQR